RHARAPPAGELVELHLHAVRRGPGARGFRVELLLEPREPCQTALREDLRAFLELARIGDDGLELAELQPPRLDGHRPSMTSGRTSWFFIIRSIPRTSIFGVAPKHATPSDSTVAASS